MTDAKRYCKEITTVMKQLEKIDIPDGINGQDLADALNALTLHRESIIQEHINCGLWDDKEVKEVEKGFCATEKLDIAFKDFKEEVLSVVIMPEGKKPSDIKEENTYCGGGEDAPSEGGD